MKVRLPDGSKVTRRLTTADTLDVSIHGNGVESTVLSIKTITHTVWGGLEEGKGLCDFVVKMKVG